MPVVRVSLHLPGITTDFVAIDFLVDTGATDTYLHPLDALTRIGIEPAVLAAPQRWSQRRTTHGIGGNVICYVHPAVYVFHHDDGHTQQVTQEIEIATLTSESSKLPFLLGVDILRYFKLSMDSASQRLALE